MKNKGQAALEFLTTYGWAFLVILVMIGALSYFGVLNPSNLVPDSCISTVGISCKEFAFNSDFDLVIIMKNEFEPIVLEDPWSVESNTIDLSDCTAGFMAVYTPNALGINLVNVGGFPVAAGETFNLSIQCHSGAEAVFTENKRHDVKIIGKYRTLGGTLDQTVTIDVSAKN